jgi:hypothetical protein
VDQQADANGGSVAAPGATLFQDARAFGCPNYLVGNGPGSLLGPYYFGAKKRQSVAALIDLAGFRTHYTVTNAKLDAPMLGNMSRSYGEGSRCREDEMQPGRSPVPLALIVAIIGSIVLFSMDFGHVAVRDDGIQKISQEALTRAQATATPTLPPGDY